MTIASGTCGTCTWSISDAGGLTIKPTSGSSGVLKQTGYLATNWPWLQYASDIKTASISGTIQAEKGKFYYMFYGCENLTSVTGMKSLSGATHLADLFSGCSALASLDLSGLDTSNVIDIGHMFYNCTLLTSIVFSNSFVTSSLSGSDPGSDPFAKLPLFVNYPITQAVNSSNKIVVTSDNSFINLSPSERAGTWRRYSDSVTYRATAQRSTSSGTLDEDGANALVTVTFSTNATTTTRTLSVYKKRATDAAYPSSAAATKTLSGNSGTDSVVVTGLDDESWDFKVVFYDGTNYYTAYPSIQTNIRLVMIDESGNVYIGGDVKNLSGTKLYANVSHGNHVPATQTASNKVFLRNDNTWQTVTPANIGALATGGGTVSGTLTLSKATNASGTANNSPALIVGGAATAAHLELDSKGVIAKSSGTATDVFHINGDALTVDQNGFTYQRSLVANGADPQSTNTALAGIYQNDKSNENIGYSEIIRQQAGIYRSFAVKNPKSNTVAGLYLTAKDDGTTTLTTNEGTALAVSGGGTGMTGVTSGSGGVVGDHSGSTIVTQSYVKWGKMCQLYVTFKRTSKVHVPASGNITNIKVFTLNNGFKPKIASAGWSNGDGAGTAWYTVGTDGKVNLGAMESKGAAWDTGTDDLFSFFSTFILP